MAHSMHQTLLARVLFLLHLRPLPIKGILAFMASSPVTGKSVETLTNGSCLEIPVAISYYCDHTFFHAFQLFVATLSSMTSAFSGGKLAVGMNICADRAGGISGASSRASADAPLVSIMV